MEPAHLNPADPIALIHPEHGTCTVRRDQLAEFVGAGWKAKADASADEVKKAEAAAAKAAPERKNARAAVEVNRVERAEAEKADKAEKAAAKKK